MNVEQPMERLRVGVVGVHGAGVAKLDDGAEELHREHRRDLLVAALRGRRDRRAVNHVIARHLDREHSAHVIVGDEAEAAELRLVLADENAHRLHQ